MKKGRVMSRDMYNHIIKNYDKLKDYDLVNGLVTTVKGSNGAIDNGYLRIKLNKKAVLVHQIIAVLSFGEDCIDKQINHKNGNKLDNRIDNLEIVTLQENIKHAIETGLYENSLNNIKLYGDNHGKSILTEKIVREIRNDKTHTQKELSKIYNVSIWTIQDVKQGKTWKHVK